MKVQATITRNEHGFVLVVTLTLLILLSILGVGLLSLSSVSLHSASQGDAMSKARANARLALMVAIGELQKEMGPDMRVSAESALLDTNESTEAIEGVQRSHWLGTYDSWGNWLNTTYTRPGGGTALTIQDTYSKGRKPMFRRWLLSLPEGQEKNFDAPVSPVGMEDAKTAVMVGEGSLGASASANPDRVTRAFITKLGTEGGCAWWIGPENHKARVDLAKKPRTLAMTDWETSHGNTAEAGIGSLQGFEFLDTDPTVSSRLVSQPSLQAAGATKGDAQDSFFDLTARSKGVLASVRTGHLKRDLSLLMEMNSSILPAPYKFNVATDTREPSIRPMSPDLSVNSPKIPTRHFQSWTQLRNFYRLYRSTSDATVSGTNGDAVLKATGAKRWTQFASPTDLTSTAASSWKGSNAYLRLPIVAKLTFIHSLKSQFVSVNRYRLFLVYSPVYTLWNPYNTEMRIPDNQFRMFSAVYRTWPIGSQMFAGTTPINNPGVMIGSNVISPLRSGNGGDVVFKPGEFRIFSHSTQYTGVTSVDLVPGFDPMAIGGQTFQLPAFPTAPPPSTAARLWAPSDNPGVLIRFSHAEWGGNVNNGNTPGSLDLVNNWGTSGLPNNYQIDWLNKSQSYTPITKNDPTQIARFSFADSNPLPVAFHQLVIKGLSEFNYESVNWSKDWRCRNWIQSPPFYLGGGLYASEDDRTLNTQRIDCPYIVNFGPTSMAEIPKLVFHDGPRAYLGSGSNPFEKVQTVAALELPTSPIHSIAGFAAMRITPGWTNAALMNPSVKVAGYDPPDVPVRNDTTNSSMAGAYIKAMAYQSGVTGVGVGNSFLHPMISRGAVYRYFDNSKSQDPISRNNPLGNTKQNDSMFYNDYWDHVLLLNDALWDDYFVSSLSDQTRPGVSSANSLSANIQLLVTDGQLPNSRYQRQNTGQTAAQTTTELNAADGYLKAARHLMVEGMFNVNSTSVAAWQSLFAGIRERQAVYRDTDGSLKPITVPSGKRIAITRFNTEVSDKEMDNPGTGAAMPDGSPGWSGVRFLDDAQLQKLAEECVKQVKLRGPFLNFSEFINRRLSNDALGTMGALQSAIDYDDANPDSASINYRYKKLGSYMLKASDLGTHDFATPEAAVGSRFAGIPGYVIQSDILKPIANTLSVRDDTFRIRAYGESLDANGKVVARAWCEAIVQRTPEYCESVNSAEVSTREIDTTTGEIKTSNKLNAGNLLFGRRFLIESFRWLHDKEV